MRATGTDDASEAGHGELYANPAADCKIIVSDCRRFRRVQNFDNELDVPVFPYPGIISLR